MTPDRIAAVRPLLGENTVVAMARRIDVSRSASRQTGNWIGAVREP